MTEKITINPNDYKFEDFNSSVLYSNAIIVPYGADVREFGNKKVKIEIIPELENKNILPRPVVRDRNGKLAKDYSPRDWYLKLQEEIFEATDNVQIFNQFCVEYGENYKSSANAKNMTAEELADVIAVCISWLETLGYDEEKRSEIFAKVNEKNEKRGYFEE